MESKLQILRRVDRRSYRVTRVARDLQCRSSILLFLFGQASPHGPSGSSGSHKAAGEQPRRLRVLEMAVWVCAGVWAMGCDARSSWLETKGGQSY